MAHTPDPHQTGYGDQAVAVSRSRALVTTRAGVVEAVGNLGTMAERCYSKRYRDALGFAAKLHRTQRRKGTDVPYVSHLLHVSALVWEAGGDEQQAIAALLHDAVEDQGGLPTLEKIRKRYGKRVARMVWDCTDSSVDDPSNKAPWYDRKVDHLARLKNAKDDSLVVAAADKVINVEAIIADLTRHGRVVWERFNSSPQNLVWYHQQGFDIVAARLGADHLLTRRLDRGVGQLAVWAAVPRSTRPSAPEAQRADVAPVES